MKIEKNKVVTLTYTLKADNADGAVIQEVKEDKPFVHLFGVGTLLPAFENNLAGLEVGDEFGFELASKDAYGENSEKDIVKLELSIFMNNGELDKELVQVGKYIPMQNNDGHVIEGKVLSIEDDGIVMDFNHPLSGQDLYFSGKILEVRDALDEELSHGHVHGPGGHDH